MIGNVLYQQIERALWPQGELTPGSLWAILDGARDRQIVPALQMSRLDHQCLYAGDLAPELRRVAPHMVELSPRLRFTRSLLEDGWGRSWGIFVRLNDATRLRHHLRKLLTVRTEDGRRLLFRFYDPRVLRAFLPTCTRDELAQMFGPVTTYFAESADASACMHAFEFGGDRLLTTDLLFDRAAAGTTAA